MAQLSDLGVMGLAVMGANLARNAARKGFGVALYNRHGERTDKLVEEFGHEGRFTPTKDIAGFVKALSKPRVMIIMVKAGKPVDDVIDELVPHLEEGDIIIDGGNSLFTDTDRRFAALKEKKLRFIGMGVSGGEEGALEGPSMMPGGERDAYARIEPMVTKMAAQVEGTPCAAYIGLGGAGHYVKMVHNGIEYADMQLITEAYDLFKTVYGLDASAIAEIFESWKTSELDSYLVDITTEVLKKRDAKTGGALVDSIVDEAEQKGTGRWTAANALELGVPLTAITEAVFARALSGRRKLRGEAADDPALRPASGPQGRTGRHRRHSRRPLCLEDRGLCAGLRTDDGGLEGLRLGPEAWRGRHDLARRLHHPGPLPRPYRRRLQDGSRDPQPHPAGLFPGCGAEGRTGLAQSGGAGRGTWGRDPGLLVVAELLRRVAARPRPRQPAARPARLLRRPHLSASRPGGLVPHPLGPGRFGG